MRFHQCLPPPTTERFSVPWNRGIWVECGQPDGFVVFGPVDSTKHGELVKADGVIIDTMGAFIYTPNKDFYGDDTLTYVFIEREKREGEERLTSAKGTIAIHVKAVRQHVHQGYACA